jgi:TolA-binding protein
MTELRSLTNSLREELGPPPESFQQAQRARFRAALEQRAERRSRLPRLVPLVAAVVALAGALLWVTLRESPSHGVERWLAGAKLAEPFRFDDGSSILLAPDARGRLVTDTAFVRFELTAGRASFDVTPGQKRTWTITAGKNEVRVVGTRFVVSYSASQAFEVDVERGIVSVRVPERNASVELKAGDRLRGAPGRMEVAHASAKALPPPPPEPERAPESERATSPEPPASALPDARPAPSVGSPPNPEWRNRYQDGKYADSLALLRADGVTERLNELPPRTLAEVADAARLGGDLELAARALSVLMRRFPSAPEARDGQFLLGRVHALRGDQKSAIQAFEGYLKPGRSSQYANEAVGRLMELYSAQGSDERARAMAERYLERAPDGPYRRLARSLVAHH